MNETPQQAARRLSARALADGYRPQALHEYQDANGQLIFWKVRLERPSGGEKHIRPMCLNGHGYEISEPEFPNGKPLYRVPDLIARADDPAWFVEGELCADTLARLGVVATTSGGAESAKHANFSPLTKRRVIIWPDNDEPGLRHAHQVADRLIELGASVHLVDVARLDLPDKGDVVDWLELHPGATDADLDKLPLVNYAKAERVEESTVSLRALEIEEFLALRLPPREYILSPIIPTHGLAMIHAPRGVGKTHIALGIAYAVASGTKFLRWTAPQARGVLFIDGEMPASTLQERLAHIVAASEREPGAPLRIITPDLQSAGMPDLSLADGQTAIGDSLEGIDLIIVDNISTLCRSGKENESESWLTVQSWALQQRAKGRSVLFIHHSGKGGAQRGTSKREDVLDTVIGRRPPDYDPANGAVFELRYEKARGFYGKDAEPFEAALTADEHGRQCWTMRTLEDSTYERIIRLLNDGLSQAEIAAELHLAKSTVHHYTKRAKADGRIKKQEQKNG
jgi:hypothetical protein